MKAALSGLAGRGRKSIPWLPHLSQQSTELDGTAVLDGWNVRAELDAELCGPAGAPWEEDEVINKRKMEKNIGNKLFRRVQESLSPRGIPGTISHPLSMVRTFMSLSSPVRSVVPETEQRGTAAHRLLWLLPERTV